MIKFGNKLLLLSIFALILFYFLVIIFADGEKVVKIFATMKIEYLPLILFFFGLAVIVKGIRQYYLLKLSNIKIPFKDNLIINFAGLSLSFTPGGIGEIVKTKFFKDAHGIETKNIIPLVIMEKYFDFLGLATFLAFSLLFYDKIESKIVFLIGTSVLVIMFVYFRYQKRPSLLMRIKFFKKIINDEEGYKKQFKLFTTLRTILSIWPLTIIMVFFDLLATYTIFLAFNVNLLNFILVSQVTITSLLLGYMSFLPNGILVTDGSYVGMLILNNVALAMAASVVLTVRFLGLWFKIIIGVIAMKFLKNAK